MPATQRNSGLDAREMVADGFVADADALIEKAVLARMDGLGVFLAGAANVIMQLSWPEVGYGVLESRVSSGQVTRHPVKRFRTTIGFLDVAMNGSEDLRAAYREAINRQHRQVHSTTESPVRYNAFSRDLQLWVASCLYYGLRDSYVTMHGPLTSHEEEVLLRACGRFGTTLQVPAEMWHADRAGFATYWHKGLDRVSIDPPVQKYLLDILEGRVLPFPLGLVFGRPLAWFNTGFLPDPFRSALGLEWSDADERRFHRTTRIMGRARRGLPSWVRRAPISVAGADLRLRRRLGMSLA